MEDIDGSYLLWERIMDIGPKFERGFSHELQPDQIKDLLDTVPDNVSRQNIQFINQFAYDLSVPRYTLYGLIGTLLAGQSEGHGAPKELELRTERWAKNLAKDYIGCCTSAKTNSELYSCIISKQTEAQPTGAQLDFEARKRRYEGLYGSEPGYQGTHEGLDTSAGSRYAEGRRRGMSDTEAR